LSFHENSTDWTEILVCYWDWSEIDVHQFWRRSDEYSLRYPQLKLSVSYSLTSKSNHFADADSESANELLKLQQYLSYRFDPNRVFFPLFCTAFSVWIFFSRFVLNFSFILVVLPTFFLFFLRGFVSCYFISRFRAFFFILLIFLSWFLRNCFFYFCCFTDFFLVFLSCFFFYYFIFRFRAFF